MARRLGRFGRRLSIIIIGLAAVLAVIAIALKLAFPLPAHENLPPDPALPTTSSDAAVSARDFTAGREGQTALYLLPGGVDAFAMRMAMVRRATRSIDAQYYIWEDDISGRMLLQEIVAAADRGVRVRLLIDDNPTAGLDGMWAGVNAHPNIAVRLFNPLTIRAVRPANYLFDFPRLNRRMHNKSLTVDGVATIVGGRNVGDEYFGAKDEGLFIDLDALAVGAVVPDVNTEFARYWNSGSAYPAQWILSGARAMAMRDLRAPAFEDSARAAEYRAAVSDALTMLTTDDPAAKFFWAPVTLYADDPAKGLGRVSPDSLLMSRLEPIFRNARDRVELVSGYFVPGDFGAELLEGLARRGVTVRVATNGLQVTDVPVVHAGYAPYRKDLLAAGVQLYEARPAASGDDRSWSFGQTRFSGGGESVHAKTFAVDGRTFFVGSFNMDPRSALLNCEMGFVVDSPEIALAFDEVLQERLPSSAYRLSLGQDGEIEWTADVDGQQREWTQEPGTSWFQRKVVSLLSLLPIEWLL